MPRLTVLAALLLLSFAAGAVESLKISVGRISTEQGRLHDVELSLNGLHAVRQQLHLSIARMELAQPYDLLKAIDIQCPEFALEQNSLECRSGHAEIQSRWLDAPDASFSFAFDRQRSEVHLDDLKLDGGSLAVTALTQQQRWQIDLRAERLQGRIVRRLLKTQDFVQSSGRYNFQVKADGVKQDLRNIGLILTLRDLSLQNEDGTLGSEALSAKAYFEANGRGDDAWRWQGSMRIDQGAVYADPVFWEAPELPAQMTASGLLQKAKQRLLVKNFKIDHPGVFSVEGDAQILLENSSPLRQARIFLRADDLEALTATWLTPYFVATELEGIGFTGKLTIAADLHRQALSRLKADFSHLAVNDQDSRFSLSGGDGAIRWSAENGSDNHSSIAWQGLQFYQLPVGPGKITLLTRDREAVLLQPVSIPFLGGRIEIGHFAWQHDTTQQPRIEFRGGLVDVSLERLTEALDWPSLSGSISGQIPAVTYRDDRLQLGGHLKIQMFGGEIRIDDLVLVGMFSDLPQLYADVVIDHLDLQALTRKFAFGSMQGRLSGFIRDLYLEDWRPVSFYAWLGTPDDDDSRHRISQKAVQNLASIGGGGAADILSRGFLRFFDEFGYDRLGIGCYLHRGVCQLMGVEAADQGYYIVKGGGLPRIDVIGYNARIDWQVLLTRLARIGTTTDSVVE